MNLINKERLDAVTAAAQASERLRMNYNYHDDLEAPAQRLLNALEPGTLLPIHRHHHSAETYILLRGKMDVVYYNNQKEETERAPFPLFDCCNTLHPSFLLIRCKFLHYDGGDESAIKYLALGHSTNVERELLNHRGNYNSYANVQMPGLLPLQHLNVLY